MIDLPRSREERWIHRFRRFAQIQMHGDSNPRNLRIEPSWFFLCVLSVSAVKRVCQEYAVERRMSLQQSLQRRDELRV